jgi:hypothetical protein
VPWTGRALERRARRSRLSTPLRQPCARVDRGPVDHVPSLVLHGHQFAAGVRRVVAPANPGMGTARKHARGGLACLRSLWQPPVPRRKGPGRSRSASRPARSPVRPRARAAWWHRRARNRARPGTRARGGPALLRPCGSLARRVERCSVDHDPSLRPARSPARPRARRVVVRAGTESCTARHHGREGPAHAPSGTAAHGIFPGPNPRTKPPTPPQRPSVPHRTEPGRK